MLEKFNALIAPCAHAYTIFGMLALEWVAVLSVLIFPDPTRLGMAENVGLTLGGILGVVGGVHASKRIWATNDGATAFKPRLGE